MSAEKATANTTYVIGGDLSVDVATIVVAAASTQPEPPAALLPLGASASFHPMIAFLPAGPA